MFNLTDPSVQRKYALLFAPIFATLIGWAVTKLPFLAALNLTGEQVAMVMFSVIGLVAAWIHQSGVNSGQKAVALSNIHAALISAGLPTGGVVLPVNPQPANPAKS